MKLSFMTLGCPDWDLDTICKRGKEYGFHGVDFRGLKSEPRDISLSKEFTSDLQNTKRKLNDAGLEVSTISSDMKVCDQSRNKEDLEAAKRIIPIAMELGCKNIRVFGGGDAKVNTLEQLAGIGRKTMEDVLKLDGAGQMLWLFETHDNWIRSKDCTLLTDFVNSPYFGILWDMAHTSRVANESPEETWNNVGDRIRSIHIKDAVYDPSHPDKMADGWRYVPAGQGQLPLEKGIRFLLERGYQGWFTFEHEKRWKPELAEPEVVFPAFTEWMKKTFRPPQ